jgi:hypothetical protein
VFPGRYAFILISEFRCRSRASIYHLGTRPIFNRRGLGRSRNRATIAHGGFALRRVKYLLKPVTLANRLSKPAGRSGAYHEKQRSGPGVVRGGAGCAFYHRLRGAEGADVMRTGAQFQN